MALLPLLGRAVVSAAALAVPFGALALRVRGIYCLMLTRALAQMIWGYVLQAPREVLGGSDGLIGIGRPPMDWLENLDASLWQLAGANVRAVGTRDFYNLVLIADVLNLCVLAALVRSSFGR